MTFYIIHNYNYIYHDSPDKTLNEQSKDEEEEEILTPEQQQLKDLISQTLDDHLKKLKVGISSP